MKQLRLYLNALKAREEADARAAAGMDAEVEEANTNAAWVPQGDTPDGMDEDGSNDEGE